MCILTFIEHPITFLKMKEEQKKSSYDGTNTLDKNGEMKNIWFVDREELDTEIESINNKLAIVGALTLVNFLILLLLTQ
tara:strand:+ start:1151 stop:1387 length:237 start_codon:yes stop_codon:yes gene_type:complete